MPTPNSGTIWPLLSDRVPTKYMSITAAELSSMMNAQSLHKSIAAFRIVRLVIWGDLLRISGSCRKAKFNEDVLLLICAVTQLFIV